ncbi:MAG: DJ-1/PfpI family protein [Ruminococcus sp.]|nr:DJ-1/PfpI family protein [Ruminococcus sp.]
MIYVFLANGFEEVEAIAPIDLLRRSGKEVVTAGVGGKNVVGSHKIPVAADISAEEIVLGDDLEMIVLPGGMPGTLNLEKDSSVQKAIDYCSEHNKYIAAICAAPSILGHKNLLNGKTAVCYEGFEDQLSGAEIGTESIAVDGNIITARGAGVAVKFGLKLVEILVSAEASQKLSKSIMCD